MSEILFLLALASMFLAATMARQRHRSSRAWIWTTAMIGPLGPLALLTLGVRHSQSVPS